MKNLTLLLSIIIASNLFGCRYELSDAPIRAANIIIPRSEESEYASKIKQFGLDFAFDIEAPWIPYSVNSFQLSREDIRIEFGNAVDIESGERLIGLFDQGKEKLDAVSILMMWEELKLSLLSIKGAHGWKESEIDPSQSDVLK
jgi:hypothetical protein